VLAGQKLGIKEVDDGIWLASFMHYDLGYFDLEQKTLQSLDNPFGTRLSPTICHLCVRPGQYLRWRREWDSNPRYGFPHTRFPSVRLKPLGHLSGGLLLKGQDGFGKGAGPCERKFPQRLDYKGQFLADFLYNKAWRLEPDARPGRRFIVVVMRTRRAA
jgi:hypothetical protein